MKISLNLGIFSGYILENLSMEKQLYNIENNEIAIINIRYHTE